MDLLKRKVVLLNKYKEAWFPIKGFNQYQVNVEGQIRKVMQLKSGEYKISYPNVSQDKNGTLRVNINADSKSFMSQRSVAKLVYETLMGIETNRDIMFVDGDPTNTRLENMVTFEELRTIYIEKFNELNNSLSKW